jgi:hypothetical protein
MRDTAVDNTLDDRTADRFRVLVVDACISR